MLNADMMLDNLTVNCSVASSCGISGKLTNPSSSLINGILYVPFPLTINTSSLTDKSISGDVILEINFPNFSASTVISISSPRTLSNVISNVFVISVDNKCNLLLFNLIPII